MKQIKKNKKIKHFFLIFILSALILVFLNSIGFLSNINYKLTDSLYGSKKPLENIVIIAIDDESLQQIGRWPWDRNIFAETINKLNESKVIGIDLGFYETSNELSDKNLKQILNKNKDKVILSCEYTSFTNQKDNDEDDIIYGGKILLPFDELKTQNNCGYVNTIIDKDGTSRAINLNIKGNYSSFSSNIYTTYTKTNLSYEKNRYLINYVNLPGSFKTYSFVDVYHSEINPNEFKNKIVLIGVTSPDFHDEMHVPTSHGKPMSGVEIHANIIQTMLLKNNLSEISKIVQNIIIVLILLFSTILFYYLRLLKTIIILIITIIIYLFTVIYAFEKNIILNIIYPIITILFSITTYIIYYYLTEEKKKNEIKNAFGKYVSPILIEELINSPEKLKLGGEKKEITILFSDIANFTTISEKLTPEQLVHLLNEYLSEMTNIILKNNGLVDKYIGDAIMCFWGAPLENKTHAIDACASAIEMQEKLNKLRLVWQKKYGVDVYARIGINTAACVVGNMGSNDRFDYTAMGDGVNLASRLESINKAYGTYIMISEFLEEKIKPKFQTKEIDTVKVKGKNNGVKIFELINYKNKISKKELEKIKEFELALKHYKKQEFTKAKEIFEKIEDETSKIYIKRINEFLINPPEKNWDGIYTMKSK